MRFFKQTYWVMILPNFILTQKSKNARMGAGVGKFVLKTLYYSYNYLKFTVKYIKFKIKNKFLDWWFY